MVEAEVRGRVGYSFKDNILWHHDFSIKNIEIIVVEKNLLFVPVKVNRFEISVLNLK